MAMAVGRLGCVSEAGACRSVGTVSVMDLEETSKEEQATWNVRMRVPGPAVSTKFSDTSGTSNRPGCLSILRDI